MNCPGRKAYSRFADTEEVLEIASFSPHTSRDRRRQS